MNPLRLLNGTGQPEQRSFATALARSRLKASLRVLRADEVPAESSPDIAWELLPGEDPEPGGEVA
jgi:hypothetical protein